MENTLLTSPPKQGSEDPSLVAVVASLRGLDPMRQPLNILGALILKKVYCTVTRLPYFLSASSSILREEAEGDCAHSLTSLLSPCRGTCNVTLM